MTEKDYRDLQKYRNAEAAALVDNLHRAGIIHYRDGASYSLGHLQKMWSDYLNR